MKSFRQFFTEYAGMKSPEADAELESGIRTLMRAGKEIPSVPGKNKPRLTHMITTAADGIERKEKIKNSVSATINQGVAGGGY